MKNWFTVHNAHPYPDEIDWNIYLQDKYKDISSEISKGDRVFFYETKNNNQIEFKNSKGKLGIVHVGYVIGNARKRNLSEALSTYSNGERKNWSIEIPTNAKESNGFVSRKTIVKILDYANNYYFKGFNRGKGIKQIEDDDKANQLFSLFMKSNN